MTTAIYASRAGLKVALIERGLYGGQLHNTDVVENYTGFTSISSIELSERMQEHVMAQDTIDTLYANIKKVHKVDGIFELVTRKGTIKSKTVVIATGVKHKKLGVPGEKEFDGRGVSYCSVCDGSFFKGKHVAVIGGGDSAVESAIYLANIVDRVTIVHRRDTLRAEKVLQDRLFKLPNVKVIWDATVKEITGDGKVSSINLEHGYGGETTELPVEGVFVNVGMIPVTEPFSSLGIFILDEEGFVITDSRMATIQDGVYAIGDVRSDSIRQVVNATGDGAMASESIINYLQATNE